MQLHKWLGWLLAIVILTFNPLASAASGTEAEARAAFVKLVAAAKKQKVGDFKKLIAKADLAEMEAMEKERAGMIAMMMEMIAADSPKSFKGEIKGEVAIFTKQVKDGSSTSTTTVRMIREDNQWKFGKPR